MHKAKIVTLRNRDGMLLRIQPRCACGWRAMERPPADRQRVIRDIVRHNHANAVTAR